MFFANDMRTSVSQSNPEASLTDISKILGEMWKDCKNTKKYEKMAALDKARYDAEKAAYESMLEERKEAEQKANAEKLQNDKEEAMKLLKSSAVANVPVPMDDISVLTDDKSKASKKKKDPNAPKRALTAYNFFMTENQQNIKAKMTGTDIKQTDVIKEVGRQWKELAESKKAKYNKMAEKDKQRFAKEMEAYKAKQQSA